MNRKKNDYRFLYTTYILLLLCFFFIQALSCFKYACESHGIYPWTYITIWRKTTYRSPHRCFALELIYAMLLSQTLQSRLSLVFVSLMLANQTAASIKSIQYLWTNKCPKYWLGFDAKRSRAPTTKFTQRRAHNIWAKKNSNKNHLSLLLLCSRGSVHKNQANLCSADQCYDVQVKY